MRLLLVGYPGAIFWAVVPIYVFPLNGDALTVTRRVGPLKKHNWILPVITHAYASCAVVLEILALRIFTALQHLPVHIVQAMILDRQSVFSSQLSRRRSNFTGEAPTVWLAAIPDAKPDRLDLTRHQNAAVTPELPDLPTSFHRKFSYSRQQAKNVALIHDKRSRFSHAIPNPTAQLISGRE